MATRTARSNSGPFCNQRLLRAYPKNPAALKAIRNYLKTPLWLGGSAATSGDTTIIRRPTGGAPGSSWPFCHISPAGTGISTASPRSVPPPTGAPDTLSHPMRPTSPPQCAGCGFIAMLPGRFSSRGIVIPFVSGHKRCGSASVGTGRSTTMDSSVNASSLVSWTLAPATTMLNGPPSASTRMLRLVPGFPRPVGFLPMASPPNGPCPSPRPPNAIPNPPRPTPRNGTAPAPVSG